MLLTGQHFHAQGDAQVCHEVTVIDVARTPRLLWVVTDLRALLVFVERFDGRVETRIQGSSRAGEMLSITSACNHLSPASAGMRFMALLTAPSLTVCCMSNKGGLIVSPRTELMCAYRQWPLSTLKRILPITLWAPMPRLPE